MRWPKWLLWGSEEKPVDPKADDRADVRRRTDQIVKQQDALKKRAEEQNEKK